MKRMNLSVVVLLLCVMLAGCSRTYVVTLTNGTQLTCCGKPKLVGPNYVMKDARGDASTIPMTRVREIAPADMAGSAMMSGESAAPKKR